MLYADGNPVGHKEATELLDINEMREEGIESLLSLIYLAKNGEVDCCGYRWTFEEGR